MRRSKTLFATMGMAALVGASSVCLQAQTADPPPSGPDVYRANYFLGLQQSNDGPPSDATITVLDPGSNGSASLCADIYVLNPSEELEACCYAKLTPDEIVTGSVVRDLLSNPLNGSGFVIHNGVIKIIADSACKPGAPTPTPTLRAWLTRVDSTPSGGSHVTTTEFTSAALSSAEVASLATRCNDIELYGSGYGICTPPAEPPN